MITEVVPIGLLSADKEDEAILFLQKLPVSERRKKEALVEWAKYVGVALTKEMVEKLLGEDAYRSRG